MVDNCDKQFKTPTPTGDDVANASKSQFGDEHPQNETKLMIEKQYTSQMMPREVLNFGDESVGYDAIVPNVVAWRNHYDNWKEIGIVDNVKRMSSTGVEMLDFWYTTLHIGLLSETPGTLDTITSLDGLGYAPAMFVKEREGYDRITQTRRNVGRVIKFYSHLQTYHTLKIQYDMWQHYLSMRIDAHTTILKDCTSALMQLLCYWTTMKDVTTMKIAWNVVFSQWMVKYIDGVDEALVRFATFMIMNAENAFQMTQQLCTSDSISTFIHALFESKLEYRQLIIDAITDVFQNHAISFMRGQTVYVKSTNDTTQETLYAPVNMFADKTLIFVNGHTFTPCINVDGKVRLHKDITIV